MISFKKKKIFYLDFDTIFSSYIHNHSLKYDLNIFSDIELILCNDSNIRTLFVKIIKSITDDSLLILDSLNGLIDSLNIMNIFELRGNKKTFLKNKHAIFHIASYQSFNILFLLMKKIENTKIPLIVTKYQSLEKSKKMILDLLCVNDFDTNHFMRISNLVLFLEFFEKDYKTGFTILKKKGFPIFSNAYSSSSISSSSSTTINLSNRQHENFFPYSKWHYFNFIDV